MRKFFGSVVVGLVLFALISGTARLFGNDASVPGLIIGFLACAGCMLFLPKNVE